MRFNFGKNWLTYSQRALNDDLVAQGRQDFARLFAQVPLNGQAFLDIGFGQGLALCYASEAGARTTGIDVDPDNLQALQQSLQHFDLPRQPEVAIASILETQAVADLKVHGLFDVVHSWGVLHHTGDMPRAFEHALQMVAPGGYFVVAIYRRHWSSPAWWLIKWLYNHSPGFLQRLLIRLCYGVIYLAKWLVTRRNPKEKRRGMNFYYDVVDWVGGYPYEYASADEIKTLVGSHGFRLLDFFPAGVPTGCNEFVFQRTDGAD